MRIAAIVLVLLFLLAAPPAHAGLLPKYEFSVEIEPLRFADQGNGSRELSLALLTGRLEGRGERSGLHGFVSAHEGWVSNATRIEIIDKEASQDDLVGRIARGECSSVDTCAVERTFNAPNLTLGPGANFLLYADDTPFNHTSRSNFALLTLIEPPRDFGQGAFVNLTIERSLLVVADNVHAAGSLTQSSNRTIAMMPDNESALTITDSSGVSENYSGTRYLFRIYGQPLFDIRGTGLLVPFVGTGEAVLTPTSASILRDEFRPESVNGVLSSFGSNESIVSAEVAQQFREIAPILNGVFFGAAGAATVNSEARESIELGLIRYGRMTLEPSLNGATAKGTSDFLLLGAAGFYTTKSGPKIGILAVPAMSFLLWLGAAGAIVAGFVLKPAIAGAQLGGFGLIRLIGLIFHGVALILAFLLWDNEIQGFLGTSLITMLTGGAVGAGTGILVTALFELVPFTMGLFFFGMPIRFIVNSGLKIGGLQKARGIGKGIGDLAVWGLGTPFIPFFLNGLIQPLMDILGKLLPSQ